MTPAPNRLRRSLARLDPLPGWLARWLRGRIIARTIPFVGTGKLQVRELSPERCVVTLPRHAAVTNHVQGPHAAATALLVETATGLALGMHLPDDRLPLLKSMSLSYLRRSRLPQTATAWLEPAQLRRLQEEAQGDLTVAVRIEDGIADDRPPVSCEMVWAWITREPRT